MKDLSDISLQMLSCLAALITERSVTRAAERMQMGQPAMSKMLAKLREVLGDPLLVRTAHGLAPTERGLQISDGVRRYLGALQSVLREPTKINPGTASGRITVTTPDMYLMLFYPDILRQIRRLAPNVTLATRDIDRMRIKDWLEDGVCDIAIGTFETLDPGLRRSLLFSETYVCLVARSHPEIRERLTLEQYVAARHIAFNHPISNTGAPDDIVDKVLRRRGVRRKAGAHLHSSLACGYAVAQTDLVATISSRLATYFASLLPVRAVPLPIDVPPHRVSMVWHERSHQLGLHRWVRQVVKAAVQGKEVRTAAE